MKRLFLLSLAIMLCMKGGAVLNEQNLEQTLAVLRVELATTYNDLKQATEMMKKNSERQHQKMINTMQKSNQIALMLYSQKTSYTFNLTYVCHEATQMYHDFTTNMMPYDLIMNRVNSEINRYTLLIHTLQSIPPSLIKDKHLKDLPVSTPAGDKNAVDRLRVRMDSLKKKNHPFFLSEKGQEDRKECIGFANIILKKYKEMRTEFSTDSEHYEHIQKHLKDNYHQFKMVHI